MNKGLWGVATCAVLLAACGPVGEWPQAVQSSLPGAWKKGRVNIRFTWEGGRPDFARDVFLFGRLESRADPRAPGVQEGAAGPVPYPSDPQLTFEDVPNNKPLVVIVEFREDDAPLSQLLYYGLSQPFELKPTRSGGAQDVEVLVPIVPRPRISDVTFVRNGQPIVGPYREATAGLSFQTDRGACVQVSSTTEFTQAPADCVPLGVAPQEAGRMHAVTVEDVSLPDCAGACQAQLFVRVLDVNHVPSALGAATIVRDAVAPAGQGTAGRSHYGLGAVAEYVVTTSEPLLNNAAPVLLVRRDGTLVDGFFGAGTVVSPTSFKFEHTIQPADAGHHTVSFTLVDAAGNTSAAQEGQAFDVVTVGPVVRTFTVVARHSGLERVSGQDGFNILDITAEVQVDASLPAPTVVLAAGVCGAAQGVTNAVALGAGRFRWTYQYNVCAMEPEGYNAVTLDVEDAAANRTNAGNSYLADHTGPGILTGPVLLRTDGNTHATSNTVIHLNATPFLPGTQAGFRVTFWSTETLGNAPEVMVDGATATLVTGGAGAAFHVLELAAPAQHAEGDVPILATLTDSVGNAAARMLGTVRFDSTAPTLDTSSMVHVREPFRTVDVGGSFVLTVPELLEPDSAIDVYLPGNAPGTAGALVGGATAEADGRVPDAQVELDPVDAPQLLVQLRDRAGNRSALTPVARGLYGVTVYTGMPGDPRPPNPHHVFVGGWLSNGAAQPAALVPPVSAVQRAALALNDGTPLDLGVAPDDRWTSVLRGPVAVNLGYGVAMDELRGGLLVVGGSRGQRLETWWWDDNNGFRAVHPQQVLPFRAGFSLAHHTASGKTLLVGGTEPWNGVGNCPSGETPSVDGLCHSTQSWAFDGLNWVQVTGLQPPGREGAVAVYDPLRAQVVLYGGRRVEGAVDTLEDTWTFDGNGWSPVNSPDPPPKRWNAAAAFSPASNVVVLYGGTDECPGLACDLSDTWTWDGLGWTFEGDNAAAGKRAGHAMAANPVDGSVWLMGGAYVRQGTCPAGQAQVGTECLLRDSWTHAGGNTWTLVPGEPNAGLPSVGVRVALDAAAQRVVAYSPGQLSHKAHVNNGWTRLWDVTGTYPSPPPDLAQGLAGTRPMAAIPGLGAVFTFGGQPALDLDPPWRWDGGRWERVALPAGAPAPGGRSGHTFTLLPQDGHILLVGGVNATGELGCQAGGCSTTWTFDGTTWVRLITVGTFTARRLHAAAPAWDQASGRTVLLVFGGVGIGSPAPIAAPQFLAGDAWNPAPAGPTARKETAMAYEPTRQRTLLFGGQEHIDVVADLWAFENGAWSMLNPVGPRPAARTGHAMAYSPDLDGVVLYGGSDGTCGALAACVFLADAWLFKNNAWTRLLDDNGEPAAGEPADGHLDRAPRALGNPSLAWDPARNGLILLGDGPNSWTFNAAPEQRRPGVVLAVDTAVLGSNNVTRLTAVTSATGTSGARLQLFNHQTHAWDQAINSPGGPTPVQLRLDVSNNLSRFVDAQHNQLHVRLDCVAGGTGANLTADDLRLFVEYTH